MKGSWRVFFFLCLIVFIPIEMQAKEREPQEGKTLYMKHCEICHGFKGKGEGYAHFNPPVADLTISSIQNKSDKELWQSIHKGVPNTAMGMWRFVLSDDEVSAVLEYVRSLTLESSG